MCLDSVAFLLNCVSAFSFFFFFHAFFPQVATVHATVAATFDRSAMNSARMHCSWTHKFHFLSIFFIKNGSHGTIHIFKNYFATVFSVFSFQFQQNKFYPNTGVATTRQRSGCAINQ